MIAARYRVLVNLLVFGVAGVATFAWAATNVFSFDVIDDPYYLEAEFADTPGIRTGVEVAYLGVQVGQVDEVTLGDDRVLVRLRIDRGEEIPVGSGAAVARKSAVGEPFVDIFPPEDLDPEPELMVEGDRIPMERTRVPVTYSSVFDNLDALIRAVPEHDLRTLVHELAVGLEGRGQDLRRTIVASDDVLATFAGSDEVLERSIDELSRFVATLAGHRDGLGAGFDNVAALSESLARSSADLRATLVDGELVADLQQLVADNLTSLDCTVAALGPVVAGLDSDRVYAGFDALFEAGPVLQRMWSAEGVLQPESDGLWVRVVPFLGNGQDGYPAPVLYNEPLTLAPTTPVGSCPSVVPAGAGTAGEGLGAVAGPTPGSTPPDSPAAERPVVERATAQAATSQRASGGTEPFNPLWLLPAFALVAVLGAVRPWRFLPIHREEHP